MIITQIILLVVGFVMLIKGADWFVEGASGVARKMGIPQLVVGLTIVAMGTSAPEAAVSISAALKGTADIAIGNIVGSNILNILIILGLTALFCDVPIQKSTLKVEIPFTFAITAILVWMGIDETVSLYDGIILIVLFIVYLLYLLKMAKQGKQEKDEAVTTPIWKLIGLGIIGMGIVVWGADITVNAATEIAKALGMSERLIGLTIVALGTSLPELVTSVTAARKGNADIAIGNIVGSNIFNILFVLGITSLITPVPYAAGFLIDGGFAIAAVVLLFLCVVMDRKLNKSDGILMLLGYAGYFAYLIMQ